MKNIGLINGSVSLNMEDVTTYITNLNQAMNLRDRIDSSLLSVNQCRSNGVVVDDIPKHLDFYGNSQQEMYFPSEDILLSLELHNRAILGTSI